MSAKVLTIPNRLVECAGGCGALVVGEFVCANCRAFDEELRQKMRAKLMRQIARYELGLGEYRPAPPPPRSVFDRPEPVLAALAAMSALTVGFTVGVGCWLGKMAIAWLCGHPL